MSCSMAACVQFLVFAQKVSPFVDRQSRPHLSVLFSVCNQPWIPAHPRIFGMPSSKNPMVGSCPSLTFSFFHYSSHAFLRFLFLGVSSIPSQTPIAVQSITCPVRLFNSSYKIAHKVGNFVICLSFRVFLLLLQVFSLEKRLPSALPHRRLSHLLLCSISVSNMASSSVNRWLRPEVCIKLSLSLCLLGNSN